MYERNKRIQKQMSSNELSSFYYHFSLVWSVFHCTVVNFTKYILPSEFENILLKFIYSEKATKFCEIITLLLSHVVPVKSKVKIWQNFVAFSEYINFKKQMRIRRSYSPIVL